MRVSDLKKLLEEADDDMLVLIPVDNEYFDGCFQSPCMEASGVQELGIDEDDDETMKAFIFVPHGFFETAEEDVPNPKELN